MISAKGTSFPSVASASAVGPQASNGVRASAVRPAERDPPRPDDPLGVFSHRTENAAEAAVVIGDWRVGEGDEGSSAHPLRRVMYGSASSYVPPFSRRANSARGPRSLQISFWTSADAVGVPIALQDGNVRGADFYRFSALEHAEAER